MTSEKKWTEEENEEGEAIVRATSKELLQKVADLLKDQGAAGYICGVVGSDAKILSYVGATSVGDLLTIKHVVDKEVFRVIDSSSNRQSEASAPSEQ
jgi:hypothetical protein